MVILDGGPDALLPDGSGGPVLAGDEAIFIAGRVAADAPTLIRLGDTGESNALLLAYSGRLATPLGLVRITSVMGNVLATAAVVTPEAAVSVYLSDFDEPDEILICIPTVAS